MEKPKLVWVNWNDVIAPVKSCGLGLGSFADANHALIAKRVWRFMNEPRRSWRRVIIALHSSSTLADFLPLKSGRSGVWRNIIKVEKSLLSSNVDLRSLIKGVIGNGEDIRFWMDTWIGDECLKNKFPLLYRLEINKNCLVKDRIKMLGDLPTQTWNWRANPQSASEVSKLTECLNLIRDTKVTTEPDKWVWQGGSEGWFTVKDIKNKLCKPASFLDGCFHHFYAWIPKKVNIFAWIMAKNRLPTRIELQRRNIHINDKECGLCGESDETINHLLTGCYVAAVVWQRVSAWCKIDPNFVFLVKDLLKLHLTVQGNKVKKKLIQVIILTGCWAIWKARNEMIFGSKRVVIANLLDTIRATSYLWIKNRSKLVTLDWNRWCSFEPLDV